jgi:hypothetical protein
MLQFAEIADRWMAESSNRPINLKQRVLNARLPARPILPALACCRESEVRGAMRRALLLRMSD